MSRISQIKLLKIVGYLALLFVVATYAADVHIALVFVSSGVLGYLNILGILHAAISRYKGYAVGRLSILIVFAALLGDTLVIFSGYGVVLALTTTCFLLIDALVLRFQGLPVGAASGAP